MTIAAVLVLAVVQGLTEFLPVSSKTHLLFARYFLDVKGVDLAFDITLHAGSLLAILVHYRKAWLDLFRDRRREILPLVLASIPVALAGLLLKKHVESLYANLALASGMLIVTGAWLILADRFGRERHALLDAPLWKLLLVGLAQACAILPGISRSGSTIGAGFLVGLKRPDAVRFSFFLGGAAIAMALAYQGLELLKGQAAFEPVPMIVGVSVAFAVSLAAIRVVEILSMKGRFSAFALYCGAAGLLGLIYFTRG